MSTRLYWYVPLIGLLIFVDETFKYLALQRLPAEGSLVDPGPIALAIHKNLGVAFNIPFRMELVILFSIIVGFFLLRVAYKNRLRHPDITLSALIIVLGALGNLYDRIVYGFTIDYIILFGRSAINLSDLVIVGGVILLLLSSRRTKAHMRIHPDEPTN